jgi:U3 small nucleolar RNA-associated protein 22
MFIHPTDDYDFIIQLDPMALTRYHHNVAADHSFLSKQGKSANQQQREVNTGVLPGFDPARAPVFRPAGMSFLSPDVFLLSSVS